jgi:hypothetical protein
MKLFNISGYLALFFGTLAVLFTFQPQFWIIALPAAIFGYVFSIIYIFLKTRYEIKTGIINQGIVGMALSSVPVLLVLYFVFSQPR